MTPFMLAVQAQLGGEAAPFPETEASRVNSIAVGADSQMMVRSLAEQLVSEANAILREHGDVISLVDEVGPGVLGFTLGYRDRAARVQTVLAGHTALGRLVIEGESEHEPRQLTNEDELRALVLSLLVDTAHR